MWLTVIAAFSFLKALKCSHPAGPVYFCLKNRKQTWKGKKELNGTNRLFTSPLIQLTDSIFEIRKNRAAVSNANIPLEVFVGNRVKIWGRAGPHRECVCRRVHLCVYVCVCVCISDRRDQVQLCLVFISATQRKLGDEGGIETKALRGGEQGKTNTSKYMPVFSPLWRWKVTLCKQNTHTHTHTHIASWDSRDVHFIFPFCCVQTCTCLNLFVGTFFLILWQCRHWVDKDTQIWALKCLITTHKAHI